VFKEERPQYRLIRNQQVSGSIPLVGSMFSTHTGLRRPES